MQGAPLYEQKGVAQRRIAALAAVLRMARVNVRKPHSSYSTKFVLAQGLSRILAHAGSAAL